MKKDNLFSALFAASAVALVAMPAGAGEAHKGISGPFATPMEATKKCLECHENAALDVMKTTHWTWSSEQEVPGKGRQLVGKKHTINNFCISIAGNWPRCTSCHVGYGWKDANFDFSDQSRVDCLVCHDTTGTYVKPPPSAGMPAGYTGNEKIDQKPVDLVTVARNVGAPGRDNCVVCHGFGGGGNNVKHGDIDSSMKKPGREIDVHMGADGQDFTCQQCHVSENHRISGKAMVVSPQGGGTLTCTNCHEEAPHKKDVLNTHAGAVACQTCHIPTFAKGMPTKTEWDWSTAGQDIKAEEQVFGEEKRDGYDKKKGHFKWEKNVVPTYRWYNGTSASYIAGEKIDPARVTELNAPMGDIRDKNARISPFKTHVGKQVYDLKHGYFLNPKVWPAGADKDEAYWQSYDWERALRAGAANGGLAFSGSYGFAPTIMYWRINHMVAPAKDALKCNDCHSRDGRMDWTALGYKGDPMKTQGAARGK